MLEATTDRSSVNQGIEKRTIATMIEDQAIEAKILANLRKSNPVFTHNVNVISYNRIVLLAGRLPSAKMIEQVIEIASRTQHVRQVQSELTIGSSSTIGSYWYDAWLTTQLKWRLFFTKDFPASKIKIISERGIIYLMGLVTETEAQQVIQMAQQVKGVYKVITIFEHRESKQTNQSSQTTAKF